MKIMKFYNKAASENRVKSSKRFLGRKYAQISRFVIA